MSDVSSVLESLATQLGERLHAINGLVATAESCTGGWIAECLTSIAGSSAWFDRGFVTYSNEAKSDMLAVDPTLIQCFGAVSREVAEAMVVGAIQNSRAMIAVAVTGIAGPSGGTDEKPVGTVWIALLKKGESPVSRVVHLKGDRRKIRQQTVVLALEGLLDLVQDPSDHSN